MQIIKRTVRDDLSAGFPVYHSSDLGSECSNSSSDYYTHIVKLVCAFST